MKIKLNIDRTPHYQKPKNVEIARIRNRLANGSAEIDTQELTALIENGGSFTPALMTGTSGDSWQSQQVIVVDIDNDETPKDADGKPIKDETGHAKKAPIRNPLSSERAKALCAAAGITPYCIYHTFSNSEKLEKYRVVVILDEPITDAKEAVNITSRFAALFNTMAPGAADTTIADAARLIFGSYKGSIINNSGSITPLEVMRALPEIRTETPTPTPHQEPAKYDIPHTDRRYDDIKAQRRYDIESFDLESYLLRKNPGARLHTVGNTTYINPCPICGHNDCFAIKGNIFKLFCNGRDAENGDGGSIIDYFIYRDNLTRQEALQKFDSMMNYAEPTPEPIKRDPVKAEPATTEPKTEQAERNHFSKNQQLTLLGNWIKDNHREDIALFGKGLFDFKNLYKEITAGGKTFLQIVAENKNDGVTITAITAAVESAGAALAEATYQEAKAEALLAQREKLIEIMARPGVDIPYVTEHLLRVQAAIDQREVKPAAANLADTFFSYLDKDAQAVKLKYGRGFENLDRKVGAMKCGQLIVLAARPATGKSAAALQIAYNVANSGAKTLFFPLEMTNNETIERLILQQEIIKGREELNAPTEEEKENIKRFLDDLEAKGNLLFYEGVNNLEAITQTIKEQRPAFVVIDQLTQVRTARRTKDIRERYVEITADLKHIAIEYQTTILLLTQLNREAEKQNRPTLENLHESDATGQNADVVLLLQRKDPDESIPREARLDKIDIYVVKNRGGQSEIRIGQKFAGSKYRFYSERY